MLAPFVVGADTNLNGAKSGPSPGLAPTPPSVTPVWQRHSQTDRAVNKSVRQMSTPAHRDGECAVGEDQQRSLQRDLAHWLPLSFMSDTKHVVLIHGTWGRGDSWASTRGMNHHPGFDGGEQRADVGVLVRLDE